MGLFDSSVGQQLSFERAPTDFGLRVVVGGARLDVTSALGSSNTLPIDIAGVRAAAVSVDYKPRTSIRACSSA